jgi:hypothetical protein
MKLSRLCHRFDWHLFSFLCEITPEEWASWGIKDRRRIRKLYGIFMMLFMFWSFAYTLALIYERISFAAIGYIAPNAVQFTPLAVWGIMVAFALWLAVKGESWGLYLGAP